ncbi:hypothetical protein [Saccharothrix sp.]|uniref:hypothetical protein n=1 Tax=Saccharothrix sp. TaxID=1873460 RepID=UPI002810BC1A|nr:hypothetical protein [Saccharothrix sp.]
MSIIRKVLLAVATTAGALALSAVTATASPATSDRHGDGDCENDIIHSIVFEGVNQSNDCNNHHGWWGGHDGDDWSDDHGDWSNNHHGWDHGDWDDDHHDWDDDDDWHDHDDDDGDHWVWIWNID